ncbi:MAG: hypothetical protein QOF95_1960, partial [Pseudonocardiales bacterium]|nr:hypothetical protein [Pseudonocardiales bacterium]
MTDTHPGTEIAGSVDPDVFARRYLAHATSQLPGRAGNALATLAEESLAFGAVRTDEQNLLRIHDLDPDTT